MVSGGLGAGWGILLSHQRVVIGTFTGGRMNETSEVYYKKDMEVKYKGNCSDGVLNGLGSVVYLDGLEREGTWINGVPEFDPRHPKVVECVDKGLCTNTLGYIMPQRMSFLIFKHFCEHCSTYCRGERDGPLSWNYFGTKCSCIECFNK
jgi:hypothetical protein